MGLWFSFFFKGLNGRYEKSISKWSVGWSLRYKRKVGSRNYEIGGILSE